MAQIDSEQANNVIIFENGDKKKLLLATGEGAALVE